MSSAVTGVGSFNPLALIDSPTAATPSAQAAAQDSGVTAAQEFTAMKNSGDLNGLLSDSVAVGVMQIADSGSAPAGAGTEISSLVNQLIAAYDPPQQSAASLSTNPALAIIQTVDQAMAQTAG